MITPLDLGYLWLRLWFLKFYCVCALWQNVQTEQIAQQLQCLHHIHVVIN